MFFSFKNSTLLFTGSTCTLVFSTFRNRPETYKCYLCYVFIQCCNMCYEICTGTDVALFRESILRLRPSDGGNGPAYRQFSLLRGKSEGRKFGSLLSAVSVSPAEGRVDAGGEAGGQEGGGSPVSELSQANG